MIDETRYPHLARASQARIKYSTIESICDFLREERRRFRLLPGKKTMSKHAIQKLEQTYRLVEIEVDGLFRDSGAPEISHMLGTLVLAVVINGVRDLEELQARLTHDLIEDFPQRWSNHRLAACTSSRTAAIVQVCTRDRNHHMYADEENQNQVFFGHVGETRDSAENKLDDGGDNLITLSDLKKNSPTGIRLKRQKYKLREAESHLLALAIRYSYNVKLIKEAIAWNWERIAEEETRAHEQVSTP